jgi:integrase
MNLTERSVEQLKPGTERAQYRDDAQPGFGLRIEPNGRKSFYYYAKVGGRPTYKALGEYPYTSVKDARAEAVRYAGLATEWKQDGFPADKNPFEKPKPAPKPGDVPTFEQLIEAYIRDHVEPTAKNAKRAAYNVRLMMNAYFPDWKSRRLDSLTVEDMLAVKNACGERRVTANECVALVRRVLNWSNGRKNGKRNFWPIEKNIALEVETYKVKKRERFLSPEELMVFNSELDKAEHRDLRDFLILAITTGARRNDILGMRWSDIDFTREIWRVPDPKNREAYNVQLLDTAVHALKRRAKESTSDVWVFPSETAAGGHVVDLKRSWQPFRDKCGLKDFRIHDLRHTCASWMAISGESLQTIGAALGHKSLQSTARYSHLIDDSIREGRERGRAKMFEMMQKAKRIKVAPKRKQLTA